MTPDQSVAGQLSAGMMLGADLQADGRYLVDVHQLAEQTGRPVEQVVELWHQMVAEQRAAKLARARRTSAG